MTEILPLHYCEEKQGARKKTKRVNEKMEGKGEALILSKRKDFVKYTVKRIKVAEGGWEIKPCMCRDICQSFIHSLSVTA